jgi:nicotinamidase-related amidase
MIKMANKALIVIDYTYDFVALDGKLNCGEPGIAIENRIAEITNEFVNDNEFVVMAVDTHYENDTLHPETKLFPPHNIDGTNGRDLYGKVLEIYNQNKNKIYFMPKTRYSAFCGTDLDLKLRARGITEVHLVGVCTDICVLHTAVEAYNLGYTIVIHKDGVQSFNSNGHDWALGHFKNSLGATILENGVEV